jgi:hypothetical protein
MTKENENVSIANKSSYTEEEITRKGRVKEELKGCSLIRKD